MAKCLECTVCQNVMLPALTICSNGHSTCISCYASMVCFSPLCPVCRIPVFTSPTRNRLVESLADSFDLHVPCSSKDCTAPPMLYGDAVQHFMVTHFKQSKIIRCAHRGCDAFVPVNAFISHFCDVHGAFQDPYSPASNSDIIHIMSTFQFSLKPRTAQEFVAQFPLAINRVQQQNGHDLGMYCIVVEEDGDDGLLFAVRQFANADEPGPTEIMIQANALDGHEDNYASIFRLLSRALRPDERLNDTIHASSVARLSMEMITQCIIQNDDEYAWTLSIRCHLTFASTNTTNSTDIADVMSIGGT